MPYRTPTGNRVISGIQMLIVLVALTFAYTIGEPTPTGPWIILLTTLLAALGATSAYYFVTGRSEGNTAVRGFSHPRVMRTLGFAAVAVFAVLFIFTAVSGSTQEVDRSTILLNGLWGYLFIYLLANATIAQAQIMRERQSPPGPSATAKRD